jgi:hypothetical protein
MLAKTYEFPPDGSTHWSLRKMAAVMNVSKELIRKVWKEADLKPQTARMVPRDSQFEQKAADIKVLYLNPPQHAGVFCVDERVQSRRSTARIAACLYRLDMPSAMVSSTTARYPISRRRPERQDGSNHQPNRSTYTKKEFVDFF